VPQPRWQRFFSPLTRRQKNDTLLTTRRSQDAETATLPQHSFRAKGITTFLEVGGTLEAAQRMTHSEGEEPILVYDLTAIDKRAGL
jgi:hypothetical protein